MTKKRLGRGLHALIPTMDDDERGVNNVNIDSIKSNPFQPRKTFDEDKIKELATSIREHGLIQPIVVRAQGDSYELIAGERRLKALQMLGKRTIPAIVKEYTDGEMLEIALIENLQREDLNPIEEASAYKQLMDEFGLTQEELSQRIGKSRSVIANSIRLLNLPKEVQDMLKSGDITTGHGRALAGLDNERFQTELAKKIKSEELNVRDTEKIVKKFLSEGNRIRRNVAEGKEKDILLLEIEDRMKRILGTQVKIIDGKNKGKIVIEYYSGDELERIIETIFRDI